MVEWLEDHVVAISPFNMKLWPYWWNLINWRPDGTFRWKAEDRQLGKTGSVMWKGGTSKDVAPCLCRLRTDRLAPTSMYWTYWSQAGILGPISLVACHQHRVTLLPPLQWLSWERNGTDPWIGQPSCCELGREPFFSGAVALSIAVDDFVNGCYMQTAWDMYGWGPYVDRAQKVYDMLIRFSLVGCTSIQITVSLRYE
jgi:hypothetical protein